MIVIVFIYASSSTLFPQPLASCSPSNPPAGSCINCVAATVTTEVVTGNSVFRKMDLQGIAE
ncbi:hypothetical protein NC652_019289 [Populus alba x Populus x berolinensis]|nr:hypothetical protein NC652_019289 [Populus alba x Populus x berolinensis]